MGLKKGTTNNPNGRPKGSKNKINSGLREMISEYLTESFPTIIAEMEMLEPKDKIKVYTDLLQYGLPKLQATSLEVDYEKMTEEQLDYIIAGLKAEQGADND